MKLKSLLKKNLLLTLFILTVSIIYGLGHFIAPQNICGKQDLLCFTQISRVTRDEIFAYAPFVNHILKGNFFLGDVYTYEYSDHPSPFIGETAPALVFAALSIITGSIEKSFVVGDFIFPPIIFLLFYFFIQLFIKNKLFAVAVALLTVMMRDFIAVIPYPKAVIEYLLAADNQLYSLIFLRSFHPQLTFVIFLAAIFSLFKLVKKPTKAMIVTTSVLSGLLFYSYIFYWTYFFAFSSLVLVYFILKKDYKRSFRLLEVLLIALTIGSFYLYNIYKFYTLDLNQDFTQRTALAGQPIPLTIARYVAVALLFLIFFKKNGRPHLLLFLLLFTGLLIPLASKLIIGADLETLHYLRRVMMPFSTIALFIMLHKLLENRKSLLRILSVSLIAISILFSIKAQILAKERVISDYRIGNEKEVFTWLKNNTKSDDVVGSLSVAFNLGLPTYTNNKVYFPRMDRTIQPSNEGLERYVVLSSLLGIPKDEQKNRLRDEILLSYIFAYQAYSKIGSEELGLDINSPKSLDAQKKIESFAEDFDLLIDRYKLDYLVVTPEQLSDIAPNLTKIQPITSIGEYIIFKRVNAI